MNHQRSRGRSLLAPLVAASTIIVASVPAPSAFAQEYPQRTVRIIVPSVPGSSPDTLARILAEKLTISLGQSVIVENKAGAGGIVGIDSVAKAAPDGYTIGIGHDGTMAINTVVYKSLPYNPRKDFAPIAPLALNEFILVAHPSTGVKTMSGFIEYAKHKKDGATYASAGIGTPNHLFVEQLMQATGLKLVHVPYKGGGAATMGVAGGQVDFFLAGLSPALPQIKAGKIVPVAVSQPARSKLFPDLPTIGETVPGFSTKTWFGLFAPKGTPPAIIERLNKEVRSVLAQTEVKDRIVAQGMIIETGDAAVLGEMVETALEHYPSLAHKIGLEPN